MPPYLLDTNHLGAALKKNSPLREKIQKVCKVGARFATNWLVLCELEACIVNLKNPSRNRKTLDDLLKSIAIWPFSWEVVREYGEIANVLRARGRVLPQVDTALLAFAVLENATILTTDRDFEAFPLVKTDNWIATP